MLYDILFDSTKTCKIRRMRRTTTVSVQKIIGAEVSCFTRGIVFDWKLVMDSWTHDGQETQESRQTD